MLGRERSAPSRPSQLVFRRWRRWRGRLLITQDLHSGLKKFSGRWSRRVWTRGTSLESSTITVTTVVTVIARTRSRIRTGLTHSFTLLSKPALEHRIRIDLMKVVLVREEDALRWRQNRAGEGTVTSLTTTPAIQLPIVIGDRRLCLTDLALGQHGDVDRLAHHVSVLSTHR